MIRPLAISVFLLVAALLGVVVVVTSACSIESTPSGTMVMSAPYPGGNEAPRSERGAARTDDYSTYTPPPAAAAPAAPATTPGAGNSARPTVMTTDKNTAINSDTTELATFGAGCFWGVEHLFRQVPGVIDAVSGYSGGHTENPTYRDICTGRTGHAEVVQVEYDPARVGYEQLLEVFWSMHDPTQLNRQGPDFGTQYRSAIFFHTPEQEAAAKRSKEALQAMHTQERLRPVVTEITPASTFYRAEEYHQRYVEKHGEAACPTHFNNSGGGR